MPVHPFEIHVCKHNSYLHLDITFTPAGVTTPLLPSLGPTIGDCHRLHLAGLVFAQTDSSTLVSVA
jgi:hypothetical protein